MITNHEAAGLYETMATIRALESRLQDYCNRGLAGDLHFNRGQEAIAVGVCRALRKTDRIVTHHRTIAHALAKGTPLYPLVAELLGKKTGLCGGRAGEMHLSARDVGYDFSFQLVGTCIPVAAGLAWARKYHAKTDDVVAVFFGDAAMSNGQFHEGLNIASIKKVPLLLVCEDNSLAGNITPEFYQTDGMSFRQRVESYGVNAYTVDGNDVVGVINAAEEAIDEVRRYSRPVLFHCNTTRLCCHKQGQRDVRTPEVLAKLAERDPLLLLREKMGSSIDASAVVAAAEATVDDVLRLVDSDLPPEVFHD